LKKTEAITITEIMTLTIVNTCIKTNNKHYKNNNKNCRNNEINTITIIAIQIATIITITVEKVIMKL
jgi:archaellum biogenesis protein FlaJ (TadC family)